MIGDTPQADIAGANRAGWKSILVETGNYQSRAASEYGSHVLKGDTNPDYIVKNVDEAIDLIMDRARKILFQSRFAVYTQPYKPWRSNPGDRIIFLFSMFECFFVSY